MKCIKREAEKEAEKEVEREVEREVEKETEQNICQKRSLSLVGVTELVVIVVDMIIELYI